MRNVLPHDWYDCRGQVIRNKQRYLNPLAIHNKTKLISGLRSMLVQMEEKCL
jgi:hypothetical protein